MTADTVLVTGASGLVGAEVVARLMAAGRSVVALMHREAEIVRNDGSVLTGHTTVTGDVRQRGLALSTGDAAKLSTSVAVVVHCAATTAFDATEQEYTELNVTGTAEVIDFAMSLDVPLVHVSTAYVCGMRGGTINEDDLDAGQSFGNGYEDSKFRAEKLVRAAGERGLDWAIVRPGIVSGASDTGAIRDYKNLYTVVKLMVEGKLCTLPGRYDATLSLAPVDHVADVVAACALDFDAVRGRTMHALGRDILSLRELSDVLAEYPSFEVATFVPESTFAEQDLPPIEREYFRRIGSLYTSYFTRRLAFDVAEAAALLGRSAPASGKDYLRTLLDYCLETGYLGIPLRSIEDVLADEGLVGHG